MNYLSLFLNLLNMTVENAAPYLLITIGGVFVARAGVFNISMEGCTEFAAFAGISADSDITSILHLRTDLISRRQPGIFIATLAVFNSSQTRV